MALDQPSGIAVERDVLLICSTGFAGGCSHQQMEWQRCEWAGGHDEEMALVRDQRLDRTDERDVELMGESKIEQRAPVAAWVLQLLDIEAAAEGGDLL